MLDCTTNKNRKQNCYIRRRNCTTCITTLVLPRRIVEMMIVMYYYTICKHRQHYRIASFILQPNKYHCDRRCDGTRSTVSSSRILFSNSNNNNKEGSYPNLSNDTFIPTSKSKRRTISNSHGIRRSSSSLYISSEVGTSSLDTTTAFDDPTELLRSVDNSNKQQQQQDIILQQIQNEINLLNNGIPLNVNSPKQVAMAIFGTENHSTNKIILQQAAIGRLAIVNTTTKQRLAQLVLDYRNYNNNKKNQFDSTTTTATTTTKAEHANNGRQDTNNNSINHDFCLTSPIVLNDNDSIIDSDSNDGNTSGNAHNNVNSIVTDDLTTDNVLSDKSLIGPDGEGNGVYDSQDWIGWDDPNSYVKLIESLYNKPKNQVDVYWKDSLLQLSKETAKTLLSQLDFEQCPMGYDPLATPYNVAIARFLQYDDNDEDDNDDNTTDEDYDNGFSNNNRYNNGRARPIGLSSTSSRTTTTTAGKKGSFLAYCREQKRKYPDCVILTRCGDFYETFGIDAILLVEHCGLNAMAGKAKAGCPIRNVQNTIDCLTNNGYRVAVFEEGLDTDSLSGSGASAGSKSRIKSRFLAQIVSAASPTYLYNLLLSSSTNGRNYGGDVLSMSSSVSQQPRPYVGILSMQSGYTLVEIAIEERTVRVTEQLTAEAVACRLAAYPPADPLLYVPSWSEYEQGKLSSTPISVSLPFLPSRRDSASTGPGSKLRTKIIPPNLVQQPAYGLQEDIRATNVIVSELLKMTERKDDDITDNGTASSGPRRRATVDDFTLLRAMNHEEPGQTHTNPLYLETARQLGLMNDDAIPPLMSYILPNSAPAATRRFLRRYLLAPPPPFVADSMSTLVSFFRGDNDNSDPSQTPSIPPLSIPPVGKVLATLRAGQANADMYSDVLKSLTTTVIVLDLYKNMQVRSSGIVDALMILLEYESGMAADPASLRVRCLEAINKIEKVVSHIHHPQFYRRGDGTSVDGWNDQISDFGRLIPRSFLERNEACWRGQVQQSAASVAYERVDEASKQLANAITKDFWLLNENSIDFVSTKSPIIHDLFNNLLAIKDIPKGLDESTKKLYFHPKDRNGKILRTRYTTENVQNALVEYIDACTQASSQIAAALTKLSQELHDEGHFPAIVQASHTNLIISTAYYHAIKARSTGWELPTIFDEDNDEMGAGEFIGLRPYWLRHSNAVSNTFQLRGMILLTAPNMSGKRSTAAAALLSVCGLCAPVSHGTKVRRFDHLFLRGASSDVPIEKKSAFGAEMADIASLLRCCGRKSLVFVDEIGRGTSPFDGTRLSAAILESMAQSGMSGIFATHLHGIFELTNLVQDRIHPRRMAIRNHTGDSSEFSTRDSWTYKLEDGICYDSLALVTAAQFGLPPQVIDRAKSFLSSPSTTKYQEPITLGDKTTLVNLKIVEIVEKLTHKDSASIPALWNVPATFEGGSATYVLKLASDPPSIYVGETDNLRQRIMQHRAKGGLWSNLEVVAVVSASSKSEARKWENLIIQNLVAQGFCVVSTSDGRSSR